MTGIELSNVHSSGLATNWYYNEHEEIPKSYYHTVKGYSIHPDVFLKKYEDVIYLNKYYGIGRVYPNGYSNVFVRIKEKTYLYFSFCCIGETFTSYVILTNEKEDVKEINDWVDLNKVKIESNNSVIHLVKENKGEFSTKEFVIKNKLLDLVLNYNDDFIKVNDKIIDSLINKDKGIILLHGQPGTGKTTYIRHLINIIKEKKLLYISPDTVHTLSSPSFIDFMSENTNSILLIEDAETILKKRSQGDNQSISNLLNLSDGLLGDCFNIQIVCTFNTKIGDIDNALLRKGRLICEYEFKHLDAHKTKLLAESLGIEYKSEGTLSEIYNSSEEAFTKERKIIGFK